MIRTIYGNIVNTDAEIICHQVNCRGIMGSGVAKAISDKWPIVKESYIRMCNNLGPNTLLGLHQDVQVEPNKYVLNIFGQLTYGNDRNTIYTEYDALNIAFDNISNIYRDKSFAFPYKFGCGLANGNWEIVYTLINKYFGGMNVKLYDFNSRGE